MLRSLKNKASNVWQKRKASRTISTPPPELQTSSSALAESEVDAEAVIVHNNINNNRTTGNPPPYQDNPYPLPPNSVPSTISTDLEHEQQPRRQPSYPLPPTSVPSTVSTLSNYQHSQDHPTAQGHIEDPLDPEPDPYTLRYVPYTDANPLKNNMFARQAGIYGRVNPDIMGGFGDDDESIWLVDDEETDQEQQQHRNSQTHLAPTESTSQLAFGSSGSPSSHNSQAHLQQPGATPESAPSAQPAFHYQRPSFLDNDDDLLFGPPPGIVTTSGATSNQNGELTSQRGYAPISASILDLTALGVEDFDTEPFDARDHTGLPNERSRTTTTTAGPSSSTNPYVNLFEQQDNDMTIAYLLQLEQLESDTANEFRFGQRYQQSAESTDVIVTHQRTARSTVTGDLDCVVCADTKHVDAFPRFSIAATCTHPPSTCLDCIQLSIESDLNSKLWTEIRCPECRELLEYADIQRYANKQTFTKYETIALRAAMSEADNFVWCTSGCGSGQIHESGSAQPIVTCLHCNHRSCFHHNVAWHETLSCDEYDKLLADPENFRSHLELENEKWSEAQQAQLAQLDADRSMAQNLLSEDRAEMRRREDRARQEREQAQKAAKLARQIAARRKKEEAQSNATLSRTTKPCAGCGWAIEKNKGCSHMTCFRCKHEFCFECGANHRDIMRGDNSIHKKTCPHHPDNLPA
ncbi:hypothetical protein EDB82DRAFT_515332 [Fusarium venenatum]|uniref:uncharacterized protein n=1 Tax=Fusarium venenatum TaxID=56646 RepID=UPI001DBE1244|nr:hypothetical protein EDB82DRAFT_515332 [Fusarium venenatum]